MASDDERDEDNETRALGLMMGALAIVVPEQHRVLMRCELAKTEHDHTRVFLRFPGALRSEYEVVLALVPNTAVET